MQKEMQWGCLPEHPPIPVEVQRLASKNSAHTVAKVAKRKTTVAKRRATLAAKKKAAHAKEAKEAAKKDILFCDETIPSIVEWPESNAVV